MKKSIWILYDKDLHYASRLQEFFFKKNPISVAMEIYTQEEALSGRLRGGAVDVLISTEGGFRPWMETYCKIAFILSETGESLGREAVLVGRFASADSIWEEIFRVCEEKGEGVAFQKRAGGKGAKLLSFFSPARRVLQTVFSLQLGKCLSKAGGCLYLSLDPLAGLDTLFGMEGRRSLSDLLYLYGCGKTDALERMESEFWKDGEFHCLLGTGAAGDIYGVGGEEWEAFLSYLQEKADYGHVILDLGLGLRGLPAILRMSDRLIELRRPEGYEDVYDELKRASFEREMRRISEEDTLSAREVLRLPLFEEIQPLPEGLGAGAIYQYACEYAESRDGA